MKYDKLFKSWESVLRESLTDTRYFNKLIEYMNGQYTINNVFPAKKDIFRPFQLTNYNDLKVVILSHEPTHEGNSNGLGMGLNEDLVSICGNLKKVEKCIERNVKNGLFFMDYSLENWAKQGVLCLNSSLTVIKNHRNSHAIYWRPFIKYILKELNKRETGVIYCLWGNQARSFKKYINKDTNYILEADHPSEVGKIWDVDHFEKVNEILESNNGKEFKINW